MFAGERDRNSELERTRSLRTEQWRSQKSEWSHRAIKKVLEFREINSGTKEVKEPKCSLRMFSSREVLDKLFYGEFDPGSGRTLAACLTHASRTDGPEWNFRMEFGRVSGGRVSNAWVTYPDLGDNSWKRLLIPDTLSGGHPPERKGGLYL